MGWGLKRCSLGVRTAQALGLCSRLGAGQTVEREVVKHLFCLLFVDYVWHFLQNKLFRSRLVLLCFFWLVDVFVSARGWFCCAGEFFGKLPVQRMEYVFHIGCMKPLVSGLMVLRIQDRGGFAEMVLGCREVFFLNSLIVCSLCCFWSLDCEMFL